MGAVRRPKFDDVETRAAYLGVTDSARGLQWRERLAPQAAKIATTISQRYNLPELLGRVLASRDIGVEDVPVALDPTIKALMPDPSVLRDMDIGAKRIADAIEKREKIAVFGDYDVDGACSSALMKLFLAHHGIDARIYIPDRLLEGYGPNPEAIDMLARESRLIITVDCGTTSFETLAAAKPHKTDVVVVDHHQADERLPDVVAVINPNRQDDLSGLGHLCAAGVVFLLLVAVARELRGRNIYGAQLAAPNLLGMLDLVALATVCDVVPLKGLNRAYVTRGLQVMHARSNTGLKALADASGLAVAPTAYHLGFVLGPRINAGGRIGDAALCARLLSGHDEVEAARIAVLLDKLNRERKAIETATLEEAVATAERMVDEQPERAVLIVGGETWHKGVVGLVSSRLTERFRRPSCVIAWDEHGKGTASLRSIDGVDIGEAVRAAVAEGILEKGGGHAMAAGLTVLRDKLPALEAFMNARLEKKTGAARSAAALDLDGALTPGSVNDDLMALIEKAGPYGQGNPQPRFAFPAHRVRFAKVVGEAHVRCTLEAGDGSKLDAVAFRAANQPIGDVILQSAGLPIHVAGHLRRDTWNGRNRLELVIEDVADPRKQG